MTRRWQSERGSLSPTSGIGDPVTGLGRPEPGKGDRDRRRSDWGTDSASPTPSVESAADLAHPEAKLKVLYFKRPAGGRERARSAAGSRIPSLRSRVQARLPFETSEKRRVENRYDSRELTLSLGEDDRRGVARGRRYPCSRR